MDKELSPRTIRPRSLGASLRRPGCAGRAPARRTRSSRSRRRARASSVARVDKSRLRRLSCSPDEHGTQESNAFWSEVKGPLKNGQPMANCRGHFLCPPARCPYVSQGPRLGVAQNEGLPQNGLPHRRKPAVPALSQPLFKFGLGVF